MWLARPRCLNGKETRLGSTPREPYCSTPKQLNQSCFNATIRVPSFEENPLNTDAAGSAPPDAFGPFRVLHQIGAGALGPVFRAYQPEQDRLVAVKLFRLGLSPERSHQLVAELERLIAADLAHPGIAAPLATGLSDVSAYLAMDFVAADSLDTVVREGGLAIPADIVRVAAQLGSALDLAAAIGITHGSLHPRDVLLSPDDVRITGIGITQALGLVGFATPIQRPYAAPERSTGERWDRRADVFSLAALLYELLTRRRIAGPGDQAADGMGEVAGANVDGLHKAFTRALAEDPDDRFPTAGDFAKAVQAAFEKKRPVTARTPSTMRSARAERTERAVAEPAFAPMPAEELPLLTDEMLSSGTKPAPVPAMSPPPIADTGHEALDTIDPLGKIGIDSPAPTYDFPLSTIAHDSSIDDHALITHDHPSTTDDHRLTNDAAPFEAVASDQRSSSGVWPLMLALVVGTALGFGMAMLLLGRDRVPGSEQAIAIGGRLAPTEIRDEPIREFTDRAVAAPSNAPAPVAASKLPVAAAPAAPEPSSASQAVMKPPTVKLPAAKTSPAKPTAAPSTARNSVESRKGKATLSRQPAKPVAAATRPANRPAPSGATAKTTPLAPAKTGPGSLVVDSRPVGTSVFVDGRLVGTTPLILETISVGDHAVHLDREGYRRWATSIRVMSGERSKVSASLER